MAPISASSTKERTRRPAKEDAEEHDRDHPDGAEIGLRQDQDRRIASSRNAGITSRRRRSPVARARERARQRDDETDLDQLRRLYRDEAEVDPMPRAAPTLPMTGTITRTRAKA